MRRQLLVDLIAAYFALDGGGSPFVAWGCCRLRALIRSACPFVTGSGCAVRAAWSAARTVPARWVWWSMRKPRKHVLGGASSLALISPYAGNHTHPRDERGPDN